MVGRYIYDEITVQDEDNYITILVHTASARQEKPYIHVNILYSSLQEIVLV